MLNAAVQSKDIVELRRHRRRSQGDALMQSPEPFEVQLGKACLPITVLLDREMDAIFKDIIENLLEDCPLQTQRASAANRIVLLCRSLRDELDRYTHLRALIDAGENLDDDAIGF
jgi:hypothetical protein